jgi:lipopolysaccharide/colanic/teichoic acid biosynthesis glycosyltransferase
MSIISATLQRTFIIDPKYQRAKRVVDLIVTLLILLPLCLITAVIAVLIRLDSQGPAFFRQKRVGENGVEFSILKFRSMYVNNDNSRHREAIVNYMNGQKLVEGTTEVQPH